jgi:hypothetical protein
MRILLDERVDQRLRKYLLQHEVGAIRGLGGLKNGELLDAAESAGFEVLLTVDRGFEHRAKSEWTQDRRRHSSHEIALKELLPHVPACLALLQTIKPGEIAKISAART